MKCRGFTLIELMIVVVIIGILGAIAYPAYNEYVNKSRRADGHSALMTAETELHKVRAAGNPFSAASFPATSPDGFYALTLTASSGNTYTLTASAQDVQLRDTSCPSLTIVRDSSGVTTYGPTACWSK